jgi:hypothetical protein
VPRFDDPLLRAARRWIAAALALEMLTLFGAGVAIAASFGAFSGGSAVHTPPVAFAYFVVSAVATLPIAARTRQLLAASGRGDVAALKTGLTPRLVLAAYFLSALLPGIALGSARDAVARLKDVAPAPD